MSDLYYEEHGSGMPLVLLHGNGESSSYFTQQIGAFAEYFRVIAVDTRGHGRSPRGTCPFTLEQFADDLRSLLRGLNIGTTHLLGFSDGGNIALLFTLKHPQLVDRLILNGANLFPAGMKIGVRISIAMSLLAAKIQALTGKNVHGKIERLHLMTDEPHIPPSDLKTLTHKTLVIAGKHDMIKLRHTRLIAASLPHAKLQIIRGNHFIAAKNPVDFNKAVLQFLLQ